MHQAMGAPIWLARTHLASARLPEGGRQLTAPTESRQMLAPVLAVARRHGSLTLEGRAAKTLEGLAHGSSGVQAHP